MIVRARAISPLQEDGRSVSRDSVCGPVAAKQLRELLPVPTRLDSELRRLPREKLQDWIGTPANEPRELRRQRTRRPSGKKKGEHDVEFERQNVLDVGIRNGAGAQLRPKRTGIGVARGGKEEGVAWGMQISLEQVESQRPRGWPNEETARTQAEKPLISSQERAGDREEESRDDARRIANAQAVRRGGCCERILCEKPLQPSQTPFNTQRIVTNKTLNGRPLIPMGVPAVKEVRHLGQCGAEDWLDLKLLDVVLVLTVVLTRAEERGGLHPCTPLSTRPRFSRRSFCAHR